MTKEDRRLAILRLYRDTELALPPKAAFINLKKRGATFSENTTQRHIRDLRDEGLLEKSPLHNGYYQITDAGLAYLRDS